MLPLGSSDIVQAAGRRRGASVKTLKKLLKKAGLKTSGKKAALTRRVKKAHLKMRGGEECGGVGQPACTEGGRRRRGGADKDCKLDADKDTEMTGYLVNGSCQATPPPATAGRRRRGSRSRKY
jgi:hypothetical protein